jgi:hypothetical protein
MSRSVVQNALRSKDAGASLVNQALRGLGVNDPAECDRATKMLAAAIAYYDNGVRDHELDPWFRECGSFDNALTVIGQQYRATKEDIHAFSNALDNMASIIGGHESLDDIYPEGDEPDHISVDEDPDSAHQGEVNQDPADHRSDPSDIRWQDRSDLSEPAPSTSSATARAGWSEPIMLDENGKAMNKPAKPVSTGLTGDASIDGSGSSGSYQYKME